MDLFSSQLQEEGNEFGPHNPPAIEAPEVPQLALGMQTMKIAEQEEESKFNIFMKIACSSGNPRAVSLNVVQQAMSRAWRNNYYKISQVNKSIFKAQFQTFEAMMAVFTRQPWVVGSDNLLLELENPEEKDPTSDYYNFDSIYVTVRAYGIPQKNRSLQLLKNILEKVGVQSEFHELKDFMLTSKPEYIWGVARMKVGMPVIDRIRLNYSNTEAGIAYLHFEKIERICLFCGMMFHTTATCHLRQQIITARICKRQKVDDIPFQRFGQWIIDYEKMPKNFAVQGEGSNPIFSTFQHPELSKLYKALESNQQRKGKLAITSTQNQVLSTQDQRNVRSHNLALTEGVPTMIQKQQHTSEAVATEIQQKVTQGTLQKMQSQDIEMLPDSLSEEVASLQNQQRQGTLHTLQLNPVVQTNQIEPQQSSFNLDTRVPLDSSFDSRLHLHMQQQNTNLNTGFQGSQTNASSKRPAPSIEPSSLPVAKKSSTFYPEQLDSEGTPTLMQQLQAKGNTAPRVCSALTLPSQLQIWEAGTMGINNENMAKRDGILGDGPNCDGSKSQGNQNKNTSAGKKFRRICRRPTGRDIRENLEEKSKDKMTKGLTQYKPDSALWSSQEGSSNLGNSQLNQTARSMIISSECMPTAASTVTPYTTDFSPWPLHISMTSCEQASNSQGNVQDGIEVITHASKETMQTQENAEVTKKELQYEAEAPAFKAPQAP